LYDINKIITTFIFILIMTAVSIGLSAQTTAPAFLSEQPPEIITDEYIESHFYDRPPELEFNSFKYGLNGRKLYVSALKGRDSNPGTESAPFLTIRKAVDICGPGDIIYVMEGTYTSAEYASVADFYNKHGTEDHWIMLRNYPGHNPLLLVKGWNGVSFQRSSFIIVSGFIIRGQADIVTYDYAYKNRNNQSPKTVSSGVTVVFSWDDYSKISHHVIVANNIVYNCPGHGIYSIRVDYISILNNITCYNAKWAPFGPSGISVYQNQAVDDSMEIKTIISGNVCYGNENKIPFTHVGVISDGNGIIVDDLKHTQNWEEFNTPDPYIGKTLVENNICFYNGGRGIHVYESEFVIVRNNTCYHNSLSGDIIGGEFSIVDCDSVVVQANIGVSRGDGGDKALLSSGCKDVEFSYNLFKGRVDSPGPGKKALTNKDPKFINTSTDPVQADFHLQKQSPAVDYSHDGAKTDLDNKTRPKGSAYDLGAYEYSP
jgi:parallel beta-helix repeat protein